jgi:hypothetical protein
MSTTSTITFPFAEAVAAFNAVMPHIGKDPTTRVIEGMYVSPEGALLATDRYTVGRYVPAYDSHDYFRARFEAENFQGAILPLDAVKFIAKMRATQFSANKWAAQFYAIRLTFDSSDGPVVRIQVLSGVNWERFGDTESNAPEIVQSARFDLIGGKFPPVERLFPDETTEFGASVISLKTSFLGRVDTAVKWLGGRSGVARFQFTKTDNPNKPGPVHARVFGDIGGASGTFEALIQPNLLMR